MVKWTPGFNLEFGEHLLDTLLLALLHKTLIIDPELEKLLTQARSVLFHTGISAHYRPFGEALAAQIARNEAIAPGHDDMHRANPRATRYRPAKCGA